MCGFFVTNKKISNEELSLIHSRLQTRGPDDVKIRIHDLGSFVFSRLACTGRQASSMQPLDDAIFSKKDFFVFNGEIYNYRELNNKYKFRPDNEFLCDTEVLDGLFKKYGFLKSINKLNGGFSIGYVEKNFKNCYITKDLYGQKSLYYSFNGKNWFFGSDPFSVAFCSNNTSSQKTLKNYLLSNEEFGTRGLMTPNQSFFNNVHSVGAGEIILLNAKGFRFIKKNTILPKKQSHPKQNFNDIIKKFNKLLDDTLKNYIDNNSDVCFEFSGGLDSTSLLLSSLKLKRKFIFYTKIAKGIDTIAIKSIRKLKQLKVKFKIVRVTKKTYLRDTIEFIRYTGLPPRWGTAPSMMPLYEKMKKDKMKICIGGAGADEFFYGYNNYDKILNTDLKKIKKLNKIEILKKYSFSGWLDNNSKDLKIYINKVKNLSKIYTNKYPDYKKNNFSICKFVRFIDLNIFMPEISEPQADLTAIMNSIELRSPYLDNNIVKLATDEINHNFLLNEKSKIDSKFFLRKALEMRCLELGLDPKLFVEKKKEGTRNFAIQTFKKMSLNTIPKEIIQKLKLNLRKPISPKMKYKIFFSSIFYMIFNMNMTNQQIIKQISK